jgi:hypothetical protein
VEALLRRSPEAGVAARPRAQAHALRSGALTLATGLCASLPVIAAAARALQEGWQPVADRGIIATRAYDVFSTHMPLVGQYSFAGTVTGKLTYSLGPMLYWLLAPAAHVGAPATFVVTMAAVNVACIVLAVWLARRRGGVWLMVLAAIAIAIMCRSLAANNFYDIWNPSAGLFPLLALIFLCWSLACGDYRLLPLAILVGSFELQCEDGFIPPSLAALAVGLGGLALWWLARRREDAPAGSGSLWRWVLAAFVVGAVCWAPAVVDQIARTGNLGLVLQAAGERKSPLGPTVGVHAVVGTVGVKPWWLTRPSDPFVRKHDVLHTAGTTANLSTALILGWLALAAALALRRRRPDVAAGAVLALALCAGIWSIANATPSTPRFLAETLGYTLWSATTVGMFVWLIALWSAVVLSGAEGLAGRGLAALAERMRPRPAARALALALAALGVLALAGAAGAVGAAAGGPDEHAFEFTALKELNARLGAVPRGHSVFLNARLDGLITPLRPELTYDLRRRGVRALGNGAYLRTGHWYERAEHPYDYIVWVYDDNRLPAAPGARVIATGRIRSGGRWHTVTVALSHVPAAKPAGRHPTQRASAREPRARLDAAVTAGGWSAPSRLGGCAAAPPQVVFPSEGPFHPTGPGAIVWAQDGGGCAASGATPPDLSLSPVGPGERAGAVITQPLAMQSAPAIAAVGASFGRVAVAAVPAPAAAPVAAASGERAAVYQGSAARAPGPPVVRGAPGGLDLGVSRAYLGDVAVAAAGSTAIAVHVQRYFQHVFSPPIWIPTRPGRITALTATMDYRADVLLAWQQNGSVYAHMLRASGRPDPTQRIGASPPNPELQALVSDNDHGMVVWSSTTGAGASARTEIQLALSQAGVRFLAPVRLTSFADPQALGSAPGSLALIRLSNENVMLAWTARESGHYVVRAAPAVFAATRPSLLLSDPGGEAVLGDLAPGPAGEAIALWRSAPGGTSFEADRAQLWAARAYFVPGDRVLARSRSIVAPAGAGVDPSVAVDPATDRAVAAWLTPGARSSVEYATAAGDAGYHPRAALAAFQSPPRGTHWLRITIAALAALAVLVLVVLFRRRHRRARAA